MNGPKGPQGPQGPQGPHKLLTAHEKYRCAAAEEIFNRSLDKTFWHAKLRFMKKNNKCNNSKDFFCMDCGECTSCNGEYYMLRDSIWYSAITAMDADGMLCIGCVERRLGRTLNREDFLLCILNLEKEENFMFFKEGSARMYDRLRTFPAISGRAPI